MQHEPLPDETVRMRVGRPGTRRRPRTPSPVDAADDTRPVTRDWLLGAPDTDPGTPAPRPPRRRRPPSRTSDDWSTEAFDRTTDLEAPGRGRGRRDHDAGRRPGRPTTSATTATVPASPRPGDEPPAGEGRGPWWRRRAVLVPAGAVAVLAAAYGADLRALLR